MTLNITRYSGFFLTITFAVLALSIVLDTLFAMPFPPGLATIIPAIFAAQLEGKCFAREHGRQPEGGEAWKITLVMTALAAIFTAALLIFQLTLPGVVTVLTDVPRDFLFGVYALVALIVLLANRVFFASGASAALRKAQQQGAASQ